MTISLVNFVGIRHLMTDLEENSFVLPRIGVLCETKSRITLQFSRKQRTGFLRDQPSSVTAGDISFSIIICLFFLVFSSWLDMK